MGKDPVYGGKTVDDWIEIVQNGKAGKREDAIQSLQGMITNGYASDKETVFKIANAVAKETHHARERTRIVAYGVIGVAVRHFAFNLANGDAREKLHASLALWLLIRGSRNLHTDLVKSAPDLIKDMLSEKKPNEERIQEIVDKLEAEKKTASGASRAAVEGALKKIEAMR
jgi:hypothetical protein